MQEARTGSGPAGSDTALPRPGLRSAVPFIAMGVVGIALVPPTTRISIDPGLEVIAVGLPCLLVLGTFLVSLRLPEPSWVDALAPCLAFGLIAIIRHLTGGSDSELAPLVTIPIFWLAMTGTRRQLWIATGLVVLMFMLPVALIGDPMYPLDDWRRALVWVMVAVFIAPAVQRLVRMLERETGRARTTAAQMDGITRGARLTSIITTDLDGRVVVFSRGAEEMLGFTADDVVGTLWLDSFHDLAELAETAHELAMEEQGFGVLRELARRSAPSRIWRMVREDGSWISIRLAMTELLDPHGDPTGYLAVGIDATEGVRLIEQLSLAEARWRVLMDHIPDLTVVVLEDDLVIRTVAGVGAMRQGLEGREGQRMESVSTEKNMSVLRPAFEQAAAGNEITTELHGSTNGAIHEIVMTPLPDDGGVRQVLVVARNVDRARRREKAFEKSIQWAEGLFENAPQGVAVVTSAGEVLQANAALRILVGDASTDLIATSLDTFSTEDATVLPAHLAKAVTLQGATVEQPWSVRRKDGSTVHLTLNSRLLDDHPIAEDGADDEYEDIVLINLVDVSERHRYEQRLAHLADHDVLTGLGNRRAFDAALELHHERGQRSGATGALLLLDLDNFKEVNDTLGHTAGDELIVSVARLLQDNVRSSDVVARLGGDEFAILLPDTDVAGAGAVARGLVERIRDHTATLAGTNRRVTASIGVVMFAAVADHDMDALALADMTMYDAKDAGRDQVAILAANSTQGPRLGARLEWKRRIDAAIENDAFELHLQPILDLRTGEIHSAEVLLRLADGKDLTPPGHFLHVAERSGQINLLDAWVVRHSIAMLAELRRIEPDFQLEVNLSGHSIGDPMIEAAIVEALAAHGVAPHALVLEITETAAVADVTIARQFAERMTQLGCRFALDDFGAGFGSFYYLKHLLFDYVKIDGDFISNCHRSDVDRMIIRSIVDIARSLGKRTVAEFVSNAEIMAVVRDEGVDLAQGYHVGKPMPASEFTSRFLELPAPA